MHFEIKLSVISIRQWYNLDTIFLLIYLEENIANAVKACFLNVLKWNSFSTYFSLEEVQY